MNFADIFVKHFWTHITPGVLEAHDPYAVHHAAFVVFVFVMLHIDSKGNILFPSFTVSMCMVSCLSPQASSLPFSPALSSPWALVGALFHCSIRTAIKNP